MFEYPSSAYMGRELWEAAAACHGPEDPPAALLRAADICREPLLVLIASCYEVKTKGFFISIPSYIRAQFSRCSIGSL